MCGITGIIAANMIGQMHMIHLVRATEKLESRGPDHQDFYTEDFVGLGHRRLSIIDTNYQANQPIVDTTGRYVIVYNGEVYNYKVLREDLIRKGYTFNTESDTEVVLNTYIEYKEKAFEKLNGFFGLAIYDKEEQTTIVARDRYGIKPLYYYCDDDKFVFASEAKALYEFKIPKKLNTTSLSTYFQLNYLPDNTTMVEGVHKVPVGGYLVLDSEHKLSTHTYYVLPKSNGAKTTDTYEQAQKKVVNLLEQSVQDRLVSDVPLGTFLSGGIDSSVISTIASKHVDKLNTFSIGYKNNPYFDETKYANAVAKKINSNHTVFSLSNQDIFDEAENVLDYLDEPFADSSALPVYILSKLTRKHVTVSLSGDGADEMFSGYNKHQAEYRILNPGTKENLVKTFGGLITKIPQSRNSKLGNFSRQVARFLEGDALSPKDRYWRWASIGTGEYVNSLLTAETQTQISVDKVKELKEHYTGYIKGSVDDVLYADMQLVLAGDMLPKVDRMSMANSLEVRVPFLDHRLVDYVSSLPESYKINGQLKKRILQDAFRNDLPAELYKRPKHGFEIPLTDYLKGALKEEKFAKLLSQEFIELQGLFQYETIDKLIKQLYSNNSQDSHAKLWAIIAFQWWYKKHDINGD